MKLRDGLMIPLVGLAGLAFGGILVAHQLSYLIVVPSLEARTDLLAHTGHAFLPHAILLAVVWSGLAAGLASVVGFRRGRAMSAGRTVTSDVAHFLAVVQITGFVLVEFIERLVAHSGVGGGLFISTLLAGVVLQIPVAWAAAAILRVIEVSASGIAKLITKSSGRLSLRAVVQASRRRAAVATSGSGSCSPIRAPPLTPATVFID